jgi:hypothetical protein
MLSVIVRKSSYEHVSNSEWSQRWSSLNLAFESVGFLFVDLDEERSFQKNRIGGLHFGCC